MIQDIVGINSKSFNNYSSNDCFSKVNIIFGINGSGKTSLASWLAEKEKSNSGSPRMFNSEYVHESIYTQDTLDGVELTVGQVAVNVKNNIDRIKDANANINEQITQLQSKLTTEKRVLFDILNSALSQAKSNFDLSKNINQKRNAEDYPIEAFNLWIKEIRSDIKVPKSSKELECQKDLYQKYIKDLSLLNPITEDHSKEFSIKMKKSIIPPSETITNNIVSWIRNGLKVHDMENHGETCQFCGSQFDGPVLAKKINARINNEYAEYLHELDQLKEQLSKIGNEISNLKQYNLNIDPVKKTIDGTVSRIDDKLENTAVSISVDDIDFYVIFNFYNEVQEKKSYYENKIKDIDDQQYQIESVAKSWVGSQLKENKEAWSLINSIQKNDKLKKKYEDCYNKNKKWVSEQESSISNLTGFRDLVNQEFSLLGLNFRLKITNDNKHYLIESMVTNEKLTTKDLSEGECRLLGFLYFYFDLFNKPFESLSSDTDMIIIDDPITSLDINNRYYLTELVNKLIKEIPNLSNQSQLFIFTHSSLDFHNFGFRVNTSNTKWFKISKDLYGHSSISSVSSNERKNYSDYYQANFKELFQFAILSKTKLPISNYTSYGNKARLLFESHARTHYMIENTTNNKKTHDNLKKFYQIPDKYDDSFNNMLDVINSLSHGMTFADVNTVSPIELQRHVRFLFKVLYNKDQFHVEQMAKNLINASNRNGIMSWLGSYEVP